jgi:hypothetical protein
MTPMKEYKTYTDGHEDTFDRGVNNFVTEGWAVDSRQWGTNPDGDVFIAFLSRDAKPEQKRHPGGSSREDMERAFRP